MMANCGTQRPIGWPFFLILLWFGAGNTYAGDASDLILDLPQVLNLVEGQSQAAFHAVADRQAAAAEVDRFRAGWWPTVDLTAQYTMRDNPVEALAGNFTIGTADKNSGEYALQVRELLWDGGRRSLAIQTADRELEAVRLGGMAAVQRAQLDAVNTYLGALELVGARRVLQLRLKALEDHERVVKDLFDQGLTARNDLLETQVRVRAVDDQIDAVADHLAVAHQDLNRRLGQEPEVVLVLPDSLPAAPELATDLPLLQQVALQDNTQLLAVRAKHEATGARLALARRAWYPSLFVGVQHGFVENSHLVHQTMNAVVAGMTWHVFDGGVRSAEVRQTQARTISAERDGVETRRAVTVQVDSAWRRMQQATRELETARTNVTASLENLRIVADQYREGLARSSDVLDAEALLAQSRYDRIRRHYAVYRAQCALLVAAGQDLADFYSGGNSTAQEDER